MAMKRFDYLANAFPDALNKACDELLGKGLTRRLIFMRELGTRGESLFHEKYKVDV